MQKLVRLDRPISDFRDQSIKFQDHFNIWKQEQFLQRNSNFWLVHAGYLGSNSPSLQYPIKAYIMKTLNLYNVFPYTQVIHT